MILRGEATIHGAVEIRDHNGDLITEVDGESASKEQTIVRERDDFKTVLGDTNARVSVGLDENLGGPYGYSSVKVRVNVTLTCDQSREKVQEAQQLAFQECVAFIEETVGHGYKLLESHLARHYRREE